MWAGTDSGTDFRTNDQAATKKKSHGLSIYDRPVKGYMINSDGGDFRFFLT